MSNTQTTSSAFDSTQLDHDSREALIHSVYALNVLRQHATADPRAIVVLELLEQEK